MEKFDRRRLLAGAGLAALAAPGLAGCTDSGSTDTSAGRDNASVKLPTYRKYDGVKPDLPGSAEGVPDGFLSYPRPAPKAVPEQPAAGGAVTAMISISVQGPTPMAANRWWQGLNDRLGCELQVDMTPSADYDARLSTALAGDELPDLVRLNPSYPRLPDVLEAKFTDLTDHLSGDAAADYPFLAALPPATWQNTVFKGRIFTIPPQNIVGTPTWITRNEVIKKLGLDPQPKDLAAVEELARGVTDAAANRYAFGNAEQVLHHLGCAMFEAPNNWSEQDGAFRLMHETDEYRAALDWTIKQWQAGVIHPDAFGKINAPQLYQSGNVVFFAWGGVGYSGVLRQNLPGMDMGFLAAPLAEGGGVAPKRLGPGISGLCGISKQDSEDRVRELLRVLDWMATPFGTAEYLYRQYGEEGTHFSWDEKLGAPIGNQLIAAEQPGGEFAYLSSGPYVLYNPGHIDKTKAMYAVQKETIPVAYKDPTLGLYSPTNDREGARLLLALTDVRDNVIMGRATMADFDAAVADWRSRGGDKIRGEYEVAHRERAGG
ncbi:hypothetical protein [Microlunatus sp. GCM10028923]|uniref:hypothetical protein n=1 Tax=Microlunatus sp. GCM10028923 TaxID=3273400 RepID=UPI00361AE69D